MCRARVAAALAVAVLCFGLVQADTTNHSERARRPKPPPLSPGECYAASDCRAKNGAAICVGGYSHPWYGYVKGTCECKDPCQAFEITGIKYNRCVAKCIRTLGQYCVRPNRWSRETYCAVRSPPPPRPSPPPPRIPPPPATSPPPPEVSSPPPAVVQSPPPPVESPPPPVLSSPPPPPAV